LKNNAYNWRNSSRTPPSLLFFPNPERKINPTTSRDDAKRARRSAGAGSGEFHVYKANRRREFESLKLMDENAQKVCLEYMHAH